MTLDTNLNPNSNPNPTSTDDNSIDIFTSRQCQVTKIFNFLISIHRIIGSVIRSIKWETYCWWKKTPIHEIDAQNTNVTEIARHWNNSLVAEMRPANPQELTI